MVDKAIFIGTSGAKNSMRELELITNNLSNVGTTGFRADYHSAQQYHLNNDKDHEGSRTYSVMDKTFSDFKTGSIINTGRDLDISVEDKGFIAVQTKSGQEGYTRAGDLQIRDGVLQTQSGNLVLGSSGVIKIGQVDRVKIGEDGTVSAQLRGTRNMIAIDHIKLVTPTLSSLQKGSDGVFHMTNGESLKADSKVRVMPGTLEGSNVNAVETLTQLISLSRQFEMHTNLMKTIEDNSTKANQILQLPG